MPPSVDAQAVTVLNELFASITAPYRAQIDAIKANREPGFIAQREQIPPLDRTPDRLTHASRSLKKK
jgi:hypothetical protein